MKKTLRSVALVSQEKVFGLLTYNTFTSKDEWEKMINSPQILEIPEDIAYMETGTYINGNFTPSPDLLEDPATGKGFAFISGEDIFATIYPSKYPTELAERYLDGLSSSPIVIEVPEEKFVFPGDTWDGTEFIEKIV